MKRRTVYVIDYGPSRNLVLRVTDEKGRVIRSQSAKTRNRRDAEKMRVDLEEKENLSCETVEWLVFRKRYESEHAMGLSENSRRKIATCLNHVETHLKPIALTDVSDSSLSTLQTALRASGVTESTIASNLGHLHAALVWGRDRGILVRVPVFPRTPRAIKKKIQRPKGRAITREEFERMLKHVEKGVGVKCAPSMKRYMEGCWLSGMRLAESLRLSWDQCEPFHVTRVGEHLMLVVPAEGEKGHENRILPITPDFEKFLLDTPKEERVGLVLPIARSRQWKGRPLTDLAVSHMITRIGRLAGVYVTAKKPASLHDFRRSFAERWSWFVQPQVLQLLMRHENIETTLKFYLGKDASKTADHLKEICNDPGNSVRRMLGNLGIERNHNPRVGGSNPSSATLKDGQE